MKIAVKTVLFISVLCLASINAYAQSGLYQNFKKLGIYYSSYTNQYWLVVYPLIDKYKRGGSFDTNNIQVTLETKSGKKIQISSNDLTVVNLGDMYFKDAAKYRLFRFNLVIDNSGSINDAHLNFVQDTLSKFVRRLPLSFEAQIIRFSTHVKKSGFTNDKNELIAWINEPYERGGTALYDAIVTAVEDLKYSDDDIPFKFSIILTDGQDNESKRYTDANLFKSKIVSDTSDLHIPLFIVGVTDAVNEPLLKEISKFGFYRHAQGFPDVDETFNFFEKLIKEVYVIKIPGVSSFSQLKKIYLGSQQPGGRPQTIQDFTVH
ncbi:hypothetical protein PN36_08875 [Candidatus Thiomargarita nelsonii]|uniref:VWFA domain-containing protein n=1 Tax=Candidatus Thiomargarita nelsonii TaxID=1003181 RepID=A0A0A6S637_9GAMM|nr:hypothetical protein PN36_08875 [Candidatus Thiomargarita nelsonii]